jgi:hypothetical protein
MCEPPLITRRGICEPGSPGGAYEPSGRVTRGLLGTQQACSASSGWRAANQSIVHSQTLARDVEESVAVRWEAA